MAQQTAVCYIINQLRQLAFNEKTHLGMGDVRVTQGLIDELEEQAKQMEKEQIKKAWFDSTLQFDNAASMVDKKEFEQYYNETYGIK